MGWSAPDIVGEGAHCLQPASDLFAVKIDARSSHRDQVKSLCRRPHFRLCPPPDQSGPATPLGDPVPYCNIYSTVIYFSKIQSISLVRPAIANANWITSACARHIDAASERKQRT